MAVRSVTILVERGRRREEETELAEAGGRRISSAACLSSEERKEKMGGGVVGGRGEVYVCKSRVEWTLSFRSTTTPGPHASPTALGPAAPATPCGVRSCQLTWPISKNPVTC
jgi:hypothetical protein